MPFYNLQPNDIPKGKPDFQSIATIQKTGQSGRFNYVVTESRELLLARSKRNQPNGHVNLANGKPVLAAGEAKFVNGQLVSINNKSGHYRPYRAAPRIHALEAFQKYNLKPKNGYQEVKF